jgi:autotransporter-associated beta strand protein
MISKRGRFALAAAVATVSLSGLVKADPNVLYWDINDTGTGGSNTTTAAGTWDNGELQDGQATPVAQTPAINWNEDPNGLTAAVAYSNVTNGFIPDVYFSAGNNVTGTYTVTLKAFNNIAASSFTLQEGKVTLSQSQGSVITLAGGTKSVRLDPNTQLTIANQAVFAGFSLGTSQLSMGTGSTLVNTNTGAGATWFGSSVAGACPINLDSGASVTFDVRDVAGIIQYSNVQSGGGSTTLTLKGGGDYRTQAVGHTFEKLKVTANTLYRPGNAPATNFDENTLTAGGGGIFGLIPAALDTTNITLQGNGALGSVNNVILHNNRGIFLGTGGGRLDTQNGSVRVNGPISGTGGLTLDRTNPANTGNATHTLAGTNTFAGDVTINRGNLTILNGSAIPDASKIILSTGLTAAGNFNVNSSETVGSVEGGNDTAGQVVMASTTLTLGGNNADTTFAGRIANSVPLSAGAIVKVGTGTWTLTTAATPTNAYLGTTTVNGGRIQSTKPVNLQGYNSPGKINVGAAGTIGVTANNGSTALWTPTDIDTLRANANFTAGGQLGIDTTGTTGGTFTYGSAISGVLGITKLGSDTLDLTSNSNAYTGATKVEGGTLKMTKIHSGTAVSIAASTKLQVVDSSPTFPSHPSGSDAQVSQPKSLTINGTGATRGTLDLGNNDMIIAYGASTPYAGVSPAAALEDLIAQGFNGGDWLGKGITSSAAASEDAAGNFVLAIVDNAVLPQPYGVSNGGDNFDGVDVAAESVLVKFTHRVDLNLDGLVTDADAIIFSTNYESGADANWGIGDLDYDGTFTDNDAIIFGTFYDTGLAHLPEPASIGMLGIAAAGLLARRRRA